MHAKKIRFKLISKIAIYLTIFIAIILTDRLLNEYQNNYIMDPIFAKAGNIQTISQFITSIDKTMDELDGFKWDYDSTDKLFSNLVSNLTEAETQFKLIQKDYNEVGKEQYLLINAIDTALKAFEDRITSLYQELTLSKTKEAYKIFYTEITVVGKYLVRYSEQLQKQAIVDNQAQFNLLMNKYRAIKIIQAIGVGLVLLVGSFALLNLIDLLQFIASLAKESKLISEGNYNSKPLNENRKDEIGYMSKAFNEMKQSMKDQVFLLEEKNRFENELYKKENETLILQNLLEREKLQQLRSQINPHFLFNTLNVIKLTADEENAEKTVSLLSSLSTLYRFALGSNDNLVLLSREVKIVNEFYALCKARFADRINLKWKITQDIDLTETLVPSFILQPIIENSFKDGLAPKENGGTITITIKCEHDFLYMIVEDDGIGMDNEQLQEIKDKMKNPPITGEHIGLYNIAARLKLLGKGSNLKMESTLGKGTTVTIKIPYMKENEEAEDDVQDFDC